MAAKKAALRGERRVESKAAEKAESKVAKKGSMRAD